VKKRINKKKLPKAVNKKEINAIFTAEEVAKHDKKDDCWMIINGSVYDVTSYFDYHPGGHQALMNFAGRDGTENVQYHSSNMMKLLEKYFYIGKLEGAKQNSCVIC